MRNEAEADSAVAKYADTVRRICFMHLKKYQDVEDVFQDVFLKYVLYDGTFESDAHEKAWLIRVAINACKDWLKRFFRRKVLSLEDLRTEPFYDQVYHTESIGLLEAMQRLPGKYKNVLYLFYYEGYTAVEIARIMNKNVNTIYTWLSRAKAQLKDALGGEYLD